MGGAGESRMTAHQQKKLDVEALKAFRDRFHLPLTDDDVAALRFLQARRRQPPRCATCARAARRSAAALPRAQRRRAAAAGAAAARPTRDFALQRRRQGDVAPRWPSCACSATCCKRPDARARASCRSSPTRRAPSAWRACSARSASTRRVGQLYEPEDAGSMLSYREARDGQLLEEGITEAGALSSWIAAATIVQRARPADAAVLHLLLDVRLPARRRPDLGRRRPARARLPVRRHRRAAPRWAARACSTRTARSHVVAATVPNCRAYDPAFADELAVILDHGMRADARAAATTSSTTSP